MTLLIHALWWQVQPSENVYSCKYSGNCRGAVQKMVQHAEQNIAVTNTI